MTQFKEKAGKDKEKASVGLYSYPVLMAADIFFMIQPMYSWRWSKTTFELCRDIAQKFNNDFNVEDFFKVPEPLIQKEFSRIMSLKEVKKMSKSELSDFSRINLTDDKESISNKIKKAKTDSLPIPGRMEELIDRPEAKNLMNIYASLSDEKLENIFKKFSGKNFSHFKENLSQLAIEKLEPISIEIKKLLDDKNYLDKILENGSQKADEISSKKLKNLHEIIGF